jgi:hypothetical protein
MAGFCRPFGACASLQKRKTRSLRGSNPPSIARSLRQTTPYVTQNNANIGCWTVRNCHEKVDRAPIVIKERNVSVKIYRVSPRGYDSFVVTYIPPVSVDEKRADQIRRSTLRRTQRRRSRCAEPPITFCESRFASCCGENFRFEQTRLIAERATQFRECG